MGMWPSEIDDMPASDFFELFIYDQMEPFGGPRGDLQAGIISATIANVNRDRNSKKFSPTDFMPFFEKPKPKAQTPEEMHAAFLAFKAGYEKFLAKKRAN